ncbi:SigB/SigF/SigG family RNA polymerase sigma factor [Luedemannella helvata]|uniref:STAS domain-containing protein n=1 Tax=Luedemannella helvata TaxID=349315 RepID=A0ABP4W7G8_9ACTN
MNRPALHTHLIDGVMLVVAEGDLDLAASSTVRTALRESLHSAPCGVVLDLTDVTLIDAAVLGILAAALGNAEEQGTSVRVVGATGTVLDVLEIVGLAKRLKAYAPRDEAPPRPSRACCTLHARSPREVMHDVIEAGLDSLAVSNETIGQLLVEAASLPEGDARRGPLREQAIELALPAAHQMASRYRNRGENEDDLRQVAALGLLKAIDGWDPARGHGFSDYAIPTVLGELRRHFRDRGWAMRVPRRLKEVLLETRRVNDQLTQELGRSPEPSDLANTLGLPTESVEAALEAAQSYRPRSLSVPVGDGSAELGDLVGAPDPGFEQVDNWNSITDVIAALPERTQRILALRFTRDLSQAQIAAEVGLSQMHVSRILNQTLATLRAAIMATD